MAPSLLAHTHGPFTAVAFCWGLWNHPPRGGMQAPLWQVGGWGGVHILPVRRLPSCCWFPTMYSWGSLELGSGDSLTLPIGGSWPCY